MKKLFKAIRQNELDEVKAIIEKKPETLACIATPPPKKDAGQSPLQVAVKVGSFDIAYYLIEKGADVNFMEEESEFTSHRCPIIQDALRTAIQSISYKKYDVSEKGAQLVKNLLLHGADPTKLSTSGFDAIDLTVFLVSDYLDERTYNSSSIELCEEMKKADEKKKIVAKQRFFDIFDAFADSGVNLADWVNRPYFCMTHDGTTNKDAYFNDKFDFIGTKNIKETVREYFKERKIKF